MKTIQYFFFVALGSILMAADCSNKDSEFYNDVYVSVPDLVHIETQSVYQAGNAIYLNSDNFSRYLEEPGQTTRLDVYKTTGGATKFDFTYLLEKEVTPGNWQLVTLGSNLLKERGIAIETDLFIQAACVYNNATAHYEFRNGLVLTEAGHYRISFGYNSTNTTSVELRSDTNGNNLFLNIDSLNAVLDAGGNYTFTVVE